jgi:hypothetical protein
MASHEHEKERGTVDHASDTSVTGGNEHLNGKFSVVCNGYFIMRV